MKYLMIMLFAQIFIAAVVSAQNGTAISGSLDVSDYTIIKTESRIRGLQLAITYEPAKGRTDRDPILFIHGASFPSQLAFGYRMNNYSWMDNLAENGFDVYALDFLGYGNSDRYPEMLASSSEGKPQGRAMEIYKDIDLAVNHILEQTGKTKVNLIAHSWGGSVGALYATKYPEKVAKLVLFAAITERQDSTGYTTPTSIFEVMTPEQRVKDMRLLTPKGKECRLEPEVFNEWGDMWLGSDPLAKKLNAGSVRFPAGFDPDVEDMLHGKSYYDPAAIKAPTLIIRGEWDTYPDNTDADGLFRSLENVPYKKYVVIEKGTHVMHLEKSRFRLYDEVLHFLSPQAEARKEFDSAIAVIFEVIPDKNQKQTYLDIAESLKPELEKIPGFISIERFQSIYQPEKILSLSFWQNEEAIRQWRNLEMHRQAQEKGRDYVFKDYHLRVAQVIRDYGMFDRDQAPKDSRTFHDPHR